MLLDVQLERKRFEGCFPEAERTEWNPSMDHGHGGYEDTMTQDYWIGWLTRAAWELKHAERQQITA